MDRELYQLAKEILISTLEQPADQRQDYLVEACGPRTELLSEVRSLLAQQEAPSPLVDDGVIKVSDRLPATIGPYEIVEVLGEGGMGVVYRGRQTEPIKRDVAVKVLHAGLNTARVLERFAWERRSLSRMNHPNIAKILDAGSDASGHPYVALELIEGEPITIWCHENNSSLAQRLSLIYKICQAVQHAHDRGVLHRDLKPSNILVREIDGEAAPCIIDFGIAKALGDDGDDTTRVEITLQGQRVGTPAYMAPEQLRGDTDDVDVRTDVYALGVILYELLAGSRPFDDKHLRSSILRDEPPRPSQNESRAENRGELKGDLDNICLMAIRPDSERRYRSATALADDLMRHRDGRPVEASPDHWRYRSGKTMRRHPVLVTVVLGVMLMAVMGVTALGLHAKRLNEERERAVTAELLATQRANDAQEIATFMENLFADLDPVAEGQVPTTALEILDNGADRLDTDLADQPSVRGRLWSVMGRVNHGVTRHELAIEQLHNSLAAYAEVTDSSAVDSMRSYAYTVLAVALYDMGDYAESEVIERKNLALIRASNVGPSVAEIVSLTDLATCLQAQSQLLAAQEMLREAIVLGAQIGDKANGDVAYTRNFLGYIYFQRGYYQSALEELTAAHEIQQNLYGDQSVALATSHNNLGGLYYSLGQYDLAQQHISASYKILQNVYEGKSHPAVSRALAHLGRIAIAQGDTVAGISFLGEAYDSALEVLGPDNPSTLNAARAKATALHLQNHQQASRELLQRTIDAWYNRDNPRPLKALDGRYQLGRQLLDSRAWLEAESILRDVVAQYEATFEASHPRLNLAMVDLAAAMLHTQHTNEARQLLQSAVPILDSVFGVENAKAVRARDLLAQAG